MPEKKAPRGIFSEYIAFYFTAAFGEQAYAVHYHARCFGHELVTRRELLPDEVDHPRAEEQYYKLQLGPLQKREPPIVSQRWRRITFIHTTGDRFQAAELSTTCLSKVGSLLIGCTMPCAILACRLSDIIP